MTRMAYTPLDGHVRTVRLSRWRRIVMLALLASDVPLSEEKLSGLALARTWSTNEFLDWLENAGWAAPHRDASKVQVWELTAEGRVRVTRVLRLYQ